MQHSVTLHLTIREIANDDLRLNFELVTVGASGRGVQSDAPLTSPVSYLASFG